MSNYNQVTESNFETIKVKLENKEFYWYQSQYNINDSYSVLTGFNDEGIFVKVNVYPSLLKRNNIDDIKQLKGATLLVHGELNIYDGKYTHQDNRTVYHIKRVRRITTIKARDEFVLSDCIISTPAIRGEDSFKIVWIDAHRTIIVNKPDVFLDLVDKRKLLAGSKIKLNIDIIEGGFLQSQLLSQKDVEIVEEVNYEQEIDLEVTIDLIESVRKKRGKSEFARVRNNGSAFTIHWKHFENEIGFAELGIPALVHRNKKINEKNKEGEEPIPMPRIRIKGKRGKTIFHDGTIFSFLSDVEITPINFERREWDGKDYSVPRTAREFWALYANKFDKLSSLEYEASVFNLKIFTKRMIDAIQYLKDMVDSDPLVYDEGTFLFTKHREEKQSLVIIHQTLTSSAAYVFISDPENVQYNWRKTSKLEHIYKSRDQFHLWKRIIHRTEEQFKRDVDLILKEIVFEPTDDVSIQEQLWASFVKREINGQMEVVDKVENKKLLSLAQKSNNELLRESSVWLGREYPEYITAGLNDKERDVRKMAVRAEISLNENKINWERLFNLSQTDRSTDLRVFIYLRLNENLVRCSPEIRAKFVNHKDPLIRFHARNAILKENPTFDQIFEWLQTEEDLNIKITLIRKFTRLNSDQETVLLEFMIQQLNEVTLHYTKKYEKYLQVLAYSYDNLSYGQRLTMSNQIGDSLKVEMKKLILEIEKPIRIKNLFTEISQEDVNALHCVGCKVEIEIDQTKVGCLTCKAIYCEYCSDFLIESGRCLSSLYSTKDHEFDPQILVDQ